MSFPRYPAYKESGFGWVECIPAQWDCLAGRRVFRQVREVPLESDVQLSATQKYGVVPQTLFMELEDQKVALALGGIGNFKRVKENDFVISLRSFQGGIEHSKYNGCVSPAYTVLRPIIPCQPAYFAYLLKSPGYVIALQSVTDGIRDGKNISYEQFGVIGLPIPSIDEQQAIATFLDHETTKIDALVAEQERLIELLKEKRQAVISHAVTKGLDPSVPMKDSGVEWLGEVPAHWETTRLKHATELIVDCPHETPTYSDDGDYLVIRTADIFDGVLCEDGLYRVSEAEYFNRVRRQSLLQGDVVYGREGERWGHAALVPRSDTFCLGQRMMQFRVAKHFYPEYMMWLLNSEVVYRQGQQDTVGATSPHVNVGTIRNYALCSPPLEEQQRIGMHLSAKACEFDALIKDASAAISLLQERRTALISAAVTGQIDVRSIAKL